MKTTRLILSALGLLAVLSMSLTAAPGRVSLVRTPNGGIQPQAAVDPGGVIHLVYYQGDPAGGNLFYVKRLPGQSEFSRPLQVNHIAGSAVAMGTIRGAQIALGKNGRVHVAWDGMGKGAAKVPLSGKPAAPLYYTRLNDSGDAFEPELNVITVAPGLDGGSSVAADPQGNVYVAWHAPKPGRPEEDESERAVFIARSRDAGKTFANEVPATSKPTGACACCGMRIFADSSGAAYLMYRGAATGVDRDALLLTSGAPGKDFVVVHRHPWKVTTCPMSSATLTEIKDGVLAAWETAGQVYWAKVNPKTSAVSSPVRPAGETARKHPVAVGNDRGEILLAWTEGTAWEKGGSVAWQLYDNLFQPTAEKGSCEGVPAWSLVTAVAAREGEFLIIY